MREALGRSRGGYGTKACVITDGAGRAVRFALAPGHAHELPLAQDRVDCLPDVPGWVVGDKGYASHAFRQFIWDQGARPAIPAKSNEAPVACPSWIDNNRNRVERLWARLKEWRAVGLPRDWGCGGGQGMTARVFGWLGIKDGMGFAPGGNQDRWVEPKRRRDGDRPPR